MVAGQDGSAAGGVLTGVCHALTRLAGAADWAAFGLCLLTAAVICCSVA
jgi:hypothetical protein